MGVGGRGPWVREPGPAAAPEGFPELTGIFRRRNPRGPVFVGKVKRVKTRVDLLLKAGLDQTHQSRVCRSRALCPLPVWKSFHQLQWASLTGEGGGGGGPESQPRKRESPVGLKKKRWGWGTETRGKCPQQTNPATLGLEKPEVRAGRFLSSRILEARSCANFAQDHQSPVCSLHTGFTETGVSLRTPTPECPGDVDEAGAVP